MVAFRSETEVKTLQSLLWCYSISVIELCDSYASRVRSTLPLPSGLFVFHADHVVVLLIVVDREPMLPKEIKNGSWVLLLSFWIKLEYGIIEL